MSINFDHVGNGNITLKAPGSGNFTLILPSADGINGQVLATNGSGQLSFIEAGGASISVSDTAPGSPTAGALWWDSSIGRLKIYYNDGDTSQWVDAAPTPSSVGISAVSDTAPTALANGLLWWDSTSGTLKVYYNDGNTSQWVDANPAIQGPEGPQGIQGVQGPAGEDGDVTRGRAVAIAMIFG